jgi:hypothetical protein
MLRENPDGRSTFLPPSEKEVAGRTGTSGLQAWDCDRCARSGEGRPSGGLKWPRGASLVESGSQTVRAYAWAQAACRLHHEVTPRNPHCPKLTWAKVGETRRSHAAGTSYGQIEARYGISRQRAIAIVKGPAWKVSAADHEVFE